MFSVRFAEIRKLLHIIQLIIVTAIKVKLELDAIANFKERYYKKIIVIHRYRKHVIMARQTFDLLFLFKIISVNTVRNTI